RVGSVFVMIVIHQHVPDVGGAEYSCQAAAPYFDNYFDRFHILVVLLLFNEFVFAARINLLAAVLSADFIERFFAAPAFKIIGAEIPGYFFAGEKETSGF